MKSEMVSKYALTCTITNITKLPTTIVGKDWHKTPGVTLAVRVTTEITGILQTVVWKQTG